MSDGHVEILTGRERRRRWSVDAKPRIVAETEEPGACVKQVAARHDVYPGLLFAWRRQVREGSLTRPQVPMFIPVETERPASPAISSPPPAPPTRTVAVAVGRIEIELGDGSRVRVDDGVSLVTLRRVISALRG
jgi:transposase